MAEPISDDERQAIRGLHAEGLGCNEIARRLGRSSAAVSRAAQAMGLSFDRAATVTATKAKRANASALRAQLMLDYLTDAQRLRQQIWQPHEYIDHGGKEFVEARWVQPEPSPVDKLKLMQASTMAADRSIRLELHDSDDGAKDAASLVKALAAGLNVAAQHLDSEGDDADRPRQPAAEPEAAP